MRAFVIIGLLMIIAIPIVIAQTSTKPIKDALVYIKHSNCVFIREGRRYSSEQAYEHLYRKYVKKHATVETVQDFIDQVATHSDNTGRPYYVIVNGVTITTKEWLQSKFKKE
jgi:hypothetical protein